MDWSKMVSFLSALGSGGNDGLLGSLGRLMGLRVGAETPADGPQLTANEWAALKNQILQDICYKDAVQGKGSYFQNNASKRHGTATALSGKSADSLAERISIDYANMLKLSESGRTTVENGVLKTTCVPNFYYDTTGNLTVGYGTNIDSHPDLLEMLEVIDNQTGHVLTLAEKQQYLERLRAQGPQGNMTEAGYGKQPVFNECSITEASATAAMQREIQNHLTELMNDFRAHGVDPSTIDHNMLKLALDLKYNVGGKLSKKYPTLFGKICSGDYESIEPKDYRARTSKTNPDACNVAREKMKGALVAQAQLVQRTLRDNPPPVGANAADIAAYKQAVFQKMVQQTFAIYNQVPNGQILLPDALRSTALSIDTALYGPLNTQQMAGAVQTADNVLAASGVRVAESMAEKTSSGLGNARYG